MKKLILATMVASTMATGAMAQTVLTRNVEARDVVENNGRLSVEVHRGTPLENDCRLGTRFCPDRATYLENLGQLQVPLTETERLVNVENTVNGHSGGADAIARNGLDHTVRSNSDALNGENGLVGRVNTAETDISRNERDIDVIEIRLNGLGSQINTEINRRINDAIGTVHNQPGSTTVTINRNDVISITEEVIEEEIGAAEDRITDFITVNIEQLRKEQSATTATAAAFAQASAGGEGIGFGIAQNDGVSGFALNATGMSNDGSHQFTLGVGWNNHTKTTVSAGWKFKY